MIHGEIYDAEDNGRLSEGGDDHVPHKSARRFVFKAVAVEASTGAIALFGRGNKTVT